MEQDMTIKTITLEELDTVTGGTGKLHQRFLSKSSGWAADYLENGKMLVTSPTGEHHQLSIGPAGIRR
jgi:hypothetical protein